MSIVVLPTNAFRKDSKQLLKRSPHIAKALSETLSQLSDDPSHPTLRTHKLKGNLAETWACSVAYDLRIVFEFIQHEGAKAILLHSIGTHDDVY